MSQKDTPDTGITTVTVTLAITGQTDEQADEQADEQEGMFADLGSRIPDDLARSLFQAEPADADRLREAQRTGRAPGVNFVPPGVYESRSKPGVAYTVQDGGEPQQPTIASFRTTFGTSGNANTAAYNAINAVKNDFIDGWVLKGTARRYGRAGSGAVTMTVNLSNQPPGWSAKTFTVTVDSESDLLRSLEKATLAVAEDAHNWLRRRHHDN